MACDMTFDAQDEMVYGGLYVTFQMDAILGDNTRTTLDAQISSLIRNPA